MDLQQLRELGGFVPPTPVKKPVTWQPIGEDGLPVGAVVNFTVHIKKHSIPEYHRMQDEARAKRRNILAAIIAESVYFGDDAKQRVTYEEASALDPTLQICLWRAFEDINPIWKADAAKNSQPPTNSGTS